MPVLQRRADLAGAFGPRQGGFSLVDMMIALVIAGIVMTFTTALVAKSVPRWRLDQSVSEIASGLRATRTKAIYDGEDTSMAFDIDRGRFTLIDGANAELSVVDDSTDPTVAHRRVAPLRKSIRFCRPHNGPPTQTPAIGADEPVTLRPKNAPNGTAAARFTSRGLLDSENVPGVIYLGDHKRRIYRRIKVSAFGIVTIEKWNGAEWSS